MPFLHNSDDLKDELLLQAKLLAMNLHASPGLDTDMPSTRDTLTTVLAVDQKDGGKGEPHIDTRLGQESSLSLSLPYAWAVKKAQSRTSC